jgi:hypothetical protein
MNSLFTNLKVHGNRIDLMKRYLHTLFQQEYLKYTKSIEKGCHDHTKFYKLVRDQMVRVESKTPATDDNMGQK